MQKLGVVVEALGHSREGGDVLGQAAPAPANARVEVARTDSFVQAHALRHELGIGAHALADPRDLVDE